MVRLARRAGEDDEILGNGMIVVAIAALIGGRLYHVIDQWVLYKDDPIKIFLPPYSGLGVYGGIVTGTIAAFLYARYKKVPFLRWADIIAPGPVHDAGDRAAGGTSSTRSCTARRRRCRGGSRSIAPTGSVARPSTTPAPSCPETTRFHPLFLYESLSGLLGALVLDLARLPRSASGCGRATCCSSSSSGTRSSGSSSRPSARATGRSSASRSPRSCPSCSSSAAGLILLWRHRPGHPIDAPATHPEVATWGAIGGPVADDDDDDDEYDDDEDEYDDDEDERRRRGRRPTTRRDDDASDDDERTSTATPSPRPTATPSPRPTSRPSPRPATDRPTPDMTAAPGSRPRRPPPGRVIAGGPGGRAGRRGRRPGLAWSTTGSEGVDPLSPPPAGRPVRPVRRLPVPDPDLGPGAPADGRLPARRGRPSGLDGPVRRDARHPGAASGVVPRQRAVDVHDALA